jgi:putative sterol carrier protein
MIVEEHIPTDVNEVYEFRVGEHSFAIEVNDGVVAFQSGSVSVPDLTISCDADMFIRIGARLLTPFDAIVTGNVKVDGDPDVIHRCTRMLGLAT